MRWRPIGKIILVGLALGSAFGCGSDDVGLADSPVVDTASANPAPTVAANPTAAPSAEFGVSTSNLLTYIHAAGLWQVSYLPTSQIKGPERDAADSFEGVEFSASLGDESFLTLGVSRFEGLEYRSSKDWSQSILQNTEESSSSYELISWEQFAVGGLVGYEAIFSRTGGAFEFVHLELHVVAGSGTYRIVGVTDQTVWNDDQELLRNLVHSFRLRQ
jgi:hypothetical protein